jgi:predicted RNA-binding protein
MKKENKNYYLLNTPPEDFKIDIKNKFSIAGFPERYKNSVKKFKPGDRIVYYIKGEYVFGAITEITGKYYYDETQIWSDWFNLFPVRIETKPVYFCEKFENMIFVKNIWDNLNFIKSKKKWGAYFQGSFRNLTKEDYKVIENALKENLESNF